MKFLDIITEILTEPKRENPKTTQDLNIFQNDVFKWSTQGRANIKKVYEEASPQERDYWGKWYHNAKNDVQELADEFGKPFEQVAAIVAITSPGNLWRANILAARRVLEGAEVVNTYPANLKKCLQVLSAESNWGSYVTGPKVSVFYKSLLDPESIKDDMVLDGHAMNIWFGKKIPLKDIPSINNDLRERMVRDYKLVAKELGVPVQAVQAVTWYIWKYTSSHLSNPPLTKNPEAGESR